MMPLEPLLVRLQGAGLLQETQGRFDRVFIDHLAVDSREIGPNGLFVAVRGGAVDGHLFIDKAVTNGAIAIVCEVMPENVASRYPGITFAHVASTRMALAELAAVWYRDPSRALSVVGVTGTNGKTTVSFLVQHLLGRLVGKTGLIGTVHFDLGGRILPATHTTPDSLAINDLLRQMVDGGCTACSMEVSSHALDQERARGIDFDVAIFTNLTQDHLDYHGTAERYFQAKKKLFDVLPASATALVNADDPAARSIVADTRAAVVTYGLGPGADLRGEVLSDALDGLRLRIEGIEEKFRLVGHFNAYNLLAAYGAAKTLGFRPGEILDALATAPPVPGRFEQFHFGDGTTAIVDYAHTPDALDNVLRTARETRPASARLWCLFGCGGDRDRTKRPLMGRIAESGADRVIVTSDNPRTEDPAVIMDHIRDGMQRPEDAIWIVNRREAIEWAAANVPTGDVLIVAGKGHENYQVVGTEKLPFDDRAELVAAFGRHGRSSS